MRVVGARERGVGAEELRWIGTDPDLFEAFYREHVEDVQRFVARRVGDRERAADLTAEVFLAAIDSAHRYEPRRFVIDPTGFRPDQTLIMSSSPTPEGYQQPVPPNNVGQERVEFRSLEQAQIDTVGQVRVAEGEVGPCEPVPASDGPAPIRAPQGGWDFSDAEYAGWGFGFGFKKGAE